MQRLPVSTGTIIRRDQSAPSTIALSGTFRQTITLPAEILYGFGDIVLMLKID